MKFPTRTKTPWTGPFSWAALATTECSNPCFVCLSDDVKVDDVAWFACSMRVLGWAMLKLGSKDMVNCGQLGMARRVFEVMEERSAVSWTAILDGVVKFDGVGNGRVVFDQINERNEVA
ncbi:hypothetical protein PS1_045575 [Malus domestica]